LWTWTSPLSGCDEVAGRGAEEIARGLSWGLIDLSGLRGEIFEASAFGTLEAKASQGKADHAKRGERVTATVRANDSLAGSLEMVRSGMLHGVNASFDTAAEGFDGVTHNPCSAAS
jgi:hypothetical protein